MKKLCVWVDCESPWDGKINVCILVGLCCIWFLCQQLFIHHPARANLQIVSSYSEMLCSVGSSSRAFTVLWPPTHWKIRKTPSWGSDGAPCGIFVFLWHKVWSWKFPLSLFKDFYFTLMTQTPVITAISTSSVEQLTEIGVFSPSCLPSLKLNGR